jgi:hypothetical protein
MAEEKSGLDKFRDLYLPTVREYEKKLADTLSYYAGPELTKLGQGIFALRPFQNRPDATEFIQNPSLKTGLDLAKDTAITVAEATPFSYLASRSATLPGKVAQEVIKSGAKKIDNVALGQDEIIDIYTNNLKRKDRIALRNATKSDESLNSFINTVNELPAQVLKKEGQGASAKIQTRYDENTVNQFANIFNSQNPFKIEYLKQSLGNQYKALYNSARDKNLLKTDVKFKGEDTTIKSILEQGKGKLKGGVSTDDVAQQLEDVLVRYKKENPNSTGYELKAGGDFNLMKYIEEVNPELAVYFSGKGKSNYYETLQKIKSEGTINNLGLKEFDKPGVKFGSGAKEEPSKRTILKTRSKTGLEKSLNMPMSTGDPIKYLPGIFSEGADAATKKTEIILAHGLGKGKIPQVIENKINLIPNKFIEEVERPTFFLTSAGNKAHMKIENQLITDLIEKYKLLGWEHSGKATDDWVNVKKIDVSKNKELSNQIKKIDSRIDDYVRKLNKLDAYTIFYNPVKDKMVSFGKEISKIPGLSNLINKVKSGEKQLTGVIDVNRLKRGGMVGISHLTRPLGNF